MHEMAIAQSIVEQVQEIAEREGISRVNAIHLRIGAMRAVVPEALEFGVEVLSQGTVMEGTKVIITEVPIRIECSACSASSSPEPGLAWLCPSCGSSEVDLVEGRELMLESIDAEE